LHLLILGKLGINSDIFAYQFENAFIREFQLFYNRSSKKFTKRLKHKLKKNQNNFEKFHSQLDLPFLETEDGFLKEIFKTLELKFGLKYGSNQKLIDLGAGNGSIVIFAFLNYSIKAFGIEINRNLKNEAKNRIKSLKKEENYKKRQFKEIKIKLGDFFLHNLKEYDYIYIYSLPSMHKYLRHVFRTAKKEAIIISHRHKLENFSSILKDEYILVHKIDNQECFTFFYKKI